MNFPNVSLIDLRLILSTINELFDKLGLVVRFLALFSIITGLVVLAGAVINSKFLRMKENVFAPHNRCPLKPHPEDHVN